MKSFWDERYGQKQYAYGEIPNEYLKEKLLDLQPGKILFPLEGEGRNAAFAAQKGWQSFAFDQSNEGKKKAKLLAQKNDIHIEYTISDMEHISYPENSFDALVLVYAHFPLIEQKRYHQKLASFLKKGGILLIEGFSKKHIEKQKSNPSVGGPKEETMLYDLNVLESDFPDFYFIESYETETELKEGICHVGTASVIRILAVKK